MTPWSYPDAAAGAAAASIYSNITKKILPAPQSGAVCIFDVMAAEATAEAAAAPAATPAAAASVSE